MKIGELAQLAQCTVETIRYYEKEGLLAAPARTAGNYRSYDNSHLERLRFIRNCRLLAMTHEEIHGLLDLMYRHAEDCGSVNQLLDQHIAHVEVRIAELSQLKLQLSQLRERCQSRQSVDTCGILQGLAEMESEPRRERHTHLG